MRILIQISDETETTLPTGECVIIDSHIVCRGDAIPEVSIICVMKSEDGAVVSPSVWRPHQDFIINEVLEHLWFFGTT
jgi:hypothetical protein